MGAAALARSFAVNAVGPLLVARELWLLLARAPRMIRVALHPGTADTGLSRPFQSRVPAGRLFSPDYAAARLLAVIDGLGPEDSGGYFAWDGQPIPW